MRENYLQFRKIPHESEAFQSRGKKRRLIAFRWKKGMRQK